MTEDDEQEIIRQAMESVGEFDEKIHTTLDELLDNIGSTARADFEEITEDGFRITNVPEIVSKPQGHNQEESYGVFTEKWVDQRSVGDTGDSFAGTIYLKFGNKKWLAIPYDC